MAALYLDVVEREPADALIVNVANQCNYVVIFVFNQAPANNVRILALGIAADHRKIGAPKRVAIALYPGQIDVLRFGEHIEFVRLKCFALLANLARESVCLAWN